MNRSIEMGSSVSHYLPKINKINQSVKVQGQKEGLHSERYRAQSTADMNSSLPPTRKLVNTNDIKKVEQYESMNEKQLLREHQKLLRIIKKFQQVIDVHLSRKKRQLRSQSTTISNKPASTRQDLLKCELANNKKIIQNYLRQIKELQSVKKQRKLNDVIQQRLQVQAHISQLKKDIFNLKNDDNMAGRSLVENRPQIQKELKQIEKDLKIQLTKKHQYLRKVQELTSQLNNLKKQCEGINVDQASNQKSNNNHILTKISARKADLEQVKKYRQQMQQTIHQNMVSKAKRNKGVSKQIQNCEKRMVEMKTRIEQYKQKINRYQIAMDILPKNTQNKLQAQLCSSINQQMNKGV